MQVAEIGCGSGLTAIWLAKTVGVSGRVAAVDNSDEQLRLAERNAASAGMQNISFYRAEAYDTSLPRESFDLVYSRFLMCHLSEPLRALSEMRALLRPGGILVCEDHDDGGIFTEPPTHAYQRLVEISRAVNESRGLDSYVGLKLPRLFREAGFTEVNVGVTHLTFLRGEEKRFWEFTLRDSSLGISIRDDAQAIAAFSISRHKTLANAEAYLVTSRSLACSAPSPRSTRAWRRHACGRQASLWLACSADVLGRADRMGQSRRPRPASCSACVVAGARARQDLGHAGYAAPASRRRVTPVARRPQHQWAVSETRTVAEVRDHDRGTRPPDGSRRSRLGGSRDDA